MIEKRRIAVLTGGRPDYGLFQPLISILRDDADVDLKLIVTGMHLMVSQGETWRQIEDDGFEIAARVNMNMSGDSPTDISGAIAAGVAGMGETLERLKPDVLVLLGDRFEALAAAIAAMISRTPIAHIHGGEATEGLIDEPIRHCITKMAHIHLTATDAYRRRVIQLGEAPDSVFSVGAIGLDNFRQLTLLGRSDLEHELSLPLGKPTFLVTYHPVTLEHETSAQHVENLISALDEFEDATIVITLPNADTDNAAIRERFVAFAAAQPARVAAFPALGSRRYLSLMAQSDLVIGNSSSGLIEAPSLPVPTVDIGDRQRGRIAPPSVIHADPDAASITTAIRLGLSDAFRSGIAGQENPYGDGETAPRIAEILKTASLGPAILKKHFYDLPSEQIA